MHSVRSRYVTSAVETVGPARLLTMLYDRMLLDVDRGIEALQAGDRVQASSHLQHAQEIVAELMVSLQPDGWDGGEKLMAIYRYLLTELIGAAVQGDAGRAQVCRDLVLPLADAWHTAADELTRAAAAPTVPAVTTDAVMGARLLGVG
ncbi:flagellar export chaperone FliS [Cellulomonas fengjieae]|uniref:Flagellar protein FliS n=1 Tax=Cellulomonas fengjieae TaxID=2819978 RepID=A0ABS3SGR7_9CELL|nr:flagellar export chaperone FliS [Cellulomonas fengjieae]MBO3084945.1 flagellar protein FliS [Cellulomonas fengjieae]MBO3100692.1 flagellar protein FliS [Cellulomonas fengjieae]QVI66454.1 flagellar protein FliS [Cellulomonas fengjieae]